MSSASSEIWLDIDHIALAVEDLEHGIKAGAHRQPHQFHTHRWLRFPTGPGGSTCRKRETLEIERPAQLAHGVFGMREETDAA